MALSAVAAVGGADRRADKGGDASAGSARLTTRRSGAEEGMGSGRVGNSVKKSGSIRHVIVSQYCQFHVLRRYDPHGIR
jgi:hypothetical protein